MVKPNDHRFRRAICENLDVCMLVEAGAGAGKTTSLVDRMLALIASGKSTVDKMAAVTFTRKAAAELTGRFQVALEKKFQEAGDQVIRERYEKALENLSSLFAGTIHSFCARLLRERPIEAGLDPGFEELEEADYALLRDRCWAEYLEGLYAEEAKVLEDIRALDIEPADLLGVYQNVALYPEVAVAVEEGKRPTFGKERDRLEAYLRQAWDSLPTAVPDKGWDPLQEILRRTRLRCRHLDLDDTVDFIKALKGLDRSAKPTLNRWPSTETARAQEEAFNTFRAEVVMPCLAKWRRYCHAFVMKLVAPGVEYFRDVRERGSLMSFNDLLIKAVELLRDRPEVRRYFQSRFTHVLVDEFQDTDPIQAELLVYLTGENVKDTSWRELQIKPGALFIVGDPKQSIYRFRRADIDTYNEMKRIIERSSGQVVPLTVNFRSLPAVCDWVNPIFQNKLPEKATQYQAAFETLDPFKTTKGGGVRRITIAKVYRHSHQQAASEDARRIASWIAWALDGNVKLARSDEEIKQGPGEFPQPGDFMILLRYKANLPVYARALEAMGIPYEISGGTAFKQSQELWHLLNLLATVAEPEDEIALVATLRGPFYGVSDDLLYRFRSQGGVFSYLIDQDGCRDAEAKEHIKHVFSQLRLFHKWARTQPPGSALSRIQDRIGIIPLALTRDMGESRAGNLLKALELLLGDTSRTLGSFPETVERLRSYYEEMDVEEMSVEPGKKNAVRIMNMHKAKGLEANVVFLADPLKDSEHPPELHISRKGGKAVGYFLVSCQKGEHSKEVAGIPPDWDRFESLETKYRQAEEDRLLYVAVTRAKQLLVVSRYPEKSDKGAWKDLYPYLNDIEELEAPHMDMPEMPRGEIAEKDFLRGRQEIADRMAAVKAKSYERESVTALAKSAGKERPFAEDSDQGMSWGRMIHRILEALVKDPAVDVRVLARNLLKEEQRLSSDLEAVVATVKGVTSSELWKRMKGAKRALVEVPFSLKPADGAVPTIVSGAIDLAFEEHDGWVIADYKTDKVNGNLGELTAYYKPQVELYRRFWEEMSGTKVKEAGLYFLYEGKWIVV